MGLYLKNLVNPIAKAIFNGMFTGPVVALAVSIAIDTNSSGAKKR